MAKKLTKSKAKEILHDKSVHGKPLTDKQRKFFGAVASGLIPYAENGIEGTMGGLTDIGFNYNGAWGGPSMQMGGSMPGSVGFMYARTNSPAPSNGKYAKKTKASAQNGQEMKYYQEGLDWKPKTISKNGGWLDKFQKGGEEEKTYGTYQLPEVVITGEAPEKGFWEQSIDSYLRENRDAGLLRALGSVVTYPLGLPQQAMMYGLTGKVQRPSEALDINNRYGALATDIVADPLILAAALEKAPAALSRASKFLTEETALKNAYKINPFAYKGQPGMMYRGLGKEGLEDALESGVFRAKQNIEPNMAGKLNLAKKFGSVYYSPKFSTASRYGDGFIAEVPRSSADWGQRYVRTDWSQMTGRQIPIDEGRILQKHWLQGYKELPKQKDGGIIEDDMGQWAHPGEITKINSNQITMQDVDYPVLGISDTGDTQMMYPDQDYSFEGSSVTEYPVAQNGITRDGYGDPDYVTGTSRRAFNKMVGFGNYLVPANTLNSAAELAEKKGYGYGEDSSGPLDAVRHASAAASVASRLPVPEFVKDYSPALDRAIRIAGANLLGIGNEIMSPNSEGLWMDIKNNYQGSLIGSIPGLTDDIRNKMIVNQLKNKQLTVDNPNKKKKETGGWLSKYE